MNKADIHSHILPYVDDGAATAEVSHELLDAEVSGGVRVICCTPHLRKGMFETTDEDIRRRFDEFSLYAEKTYQDRLVLFLAREYHDDSLLREKLRRDEVLPLGRGTFLLLEFSSSHTGEEMLEAVKLLRSFGFRALIAHVERYPHADEEVIGLLLQEGALLQSNASSILGREGFRQKRRVHRLIRKHLIHVIASDTHDPVDRPAEMDKAYEKVLKRFGKETAEKLFYENPLMILGLDKEE